MAVSINILSYVSVNLQDFINLLLEKLATKKIIIILMGDYNINILNCNSNNETSGFIDTTYASYFDPTINTSNWITATSKTLIKSIFYNTFTKNILAGNIATSILDHLTQFLIITNENKSLPEKELIGIRT